jgi:hypothetical protein
MSAAEDEYACMTICMPRRELEAVLRILGTTASGRGVPTVQRKLGSADGETGEEFSCLQKFGYCLLKTNFLSRWGSFSVSENIMEGISVAPPDISGTRFCMCVMWLLVLVAVL